MSSMMNKSSMQFACKLNAEKIIPILTQAVLQKQKVWQVRTEKEQVRRSAGGQISQLDQHPKEATGAGAKHLRDSHIKFQGDVTTLTAGLKSQSRIGSRIEAELQQISSSINEENIETIEQKKEGDILNETLQDLIEIQLFNLNITIVFNDLFCVATFSNIQAPTTTHKNSNPLSAASEAAESQTSLHSRPQTLTTYYFFSQFWCEFTRHVLSEFHQEDVKMRRSIQPIQENSPKTRYPVKSAVEEKNGGSLVFSTIQTQCQLSREPNLRPQNLGREFETNNIGSIQLQPVSMKHEFQTIKRPTLEIDEEEDLDQMEQESPQFRGREEKSEIKDEETLQSGIKDSKRNFYKSLFTTYSELPFDTCMKNFIKIYNDVFSNEKPANSQKYYLTEVQIAEFVPPLSYVTAKHPHAQKTS